MSMLLWFAGSGRASLEKDEVRLPNRQVHLSAVLETCDLLDIWDLCTVQSLALAVSPRRDLLSSGLLHWHC